MGNLTQIHFPINAFNFYFDPHPYKIGKRNKPQSRGGFSLILLPARVSRWWGGSPPQGGPHQFIRPCKSPLAHSTFCFFALTWFFKYCIKIGFILMTAFGVGGVSLGFALKVSASLTPLALGRQANIWSPSGLVVATSQGSSKPRVGELGLREISEGCYLFLQISFPSNGAEYYFIFLKYVTGTYKITPPERVFSDFGFTWLGIRRQTVQIRGRSLVPWGPAPMSRAAFILFWPMEIESRK